MFRRLGWLLLIAVAPACGGGGGGKSSGPNVPPTALVATPAGVQTGIVPVA